MNDIILQCNDICKNYGYTCALKNINISVKRGRIIGLLGPNGSGKTTLIKLINDLLVPNSGNILVNDIPIGIETKKVISYLPDCLSLPEWMKINELVEFYESFFEDFKKERAYKMIENLNLDKNIKFKALSKGNKEKVQLILTMSRKADLYLLDEPMGGVDPATRDYILNTIISNYSENSSVIISTHLIADVEKILDEVIFINKGEIILRETVDNIREERGQSVDELFREVFKC